MKVVVDHVVDDVATQSSNKHGYPKDLWEHAVEDRIETSHHQRGQHGREDQPGAVKRRLWRKKFDVTGAAGRECVFWSRLGVKKLNSFTQTQYCMLLFLLFKRIK